VIEENLISKSKPANQPTRHNYLKILSYADCLNFN